MPKNTCETTEIGSWLDCACVYVYVWLKCVEVNVRSFARSESNVKRVDYLWTFMIRFGKKNVIAQLE